MKYYKTLKGEGEEETIKKIVEIDEKFVGTKAEETDEKTEKTKITAETSS